MLNNTIRTVMRMIMPDLSKQMEAEGVFNFTDSTKAKENDKSYLHVINRNADVSVFVFSGLDVLFAGMARFEFQKLFGEIGQDFNLVFFRDVSRTTYHLTPDGETGGLEFHLAELIRVKKELGASYNVAIGSSTGGGAALYGGINADLDHVIAFGPMVTHEAYTNASMRFRAVFNLKKLFHEPMGYFELLAVSIAAGVLAFKLRRRIGEENFVTPLEDFATSTRRPRTTVIYGRECPPDVYHAEALAQFPEVNTIPLETGRHNSPAWLKERGRLEGIMASELLEAFQHVKDNTIMQSGLNANHVEQEEMQ